MKGQNVSLDPSLRSRDEIEFEAELRSRVVGQEEAITKVTKVVQKYLSGFAAPERPVGNLLFLGPTGVGKTRLAESIADILFGTESSVLRVDCAEFQASHDIAKIIGAPPGYVGHNDKGTHPLIDQEKLDKHSVEGRKLAIVLFDEIEKANGALWNLLLGITDRGRLTTGSGNVLDFTNSLILMTSNLGSASMANASTGGLGFGTKDPASQKRLTSIAIEAARKNFSPEFMNRLDETVVFHSLERKQLDVILDIELLKIQRRIIANSSHVKFVFVCDPLARDFLLKHGYSNRDNARYLRRTLEKYVVEPLSSLTTSGQIETGDTVILSASDDDIKFSKIPAVAVAEQAQWEDLRPACSED